MYSNLRPELTEFIGRAAELRALEGLVAARRVVTVVGPGGVGKTRLTKEWAIGRSQPTRPCWFVDLSEARSVIEIEAVFGRVLDLGLHEADALGQLSAAIAARGPALFILDNAEHVIEPTRDLVRAAAGNAPEARFVITSRQALALDGEARFELQPLPISDAANLFVTRSKSMRVDFAPTEAELAQIIDIVQQLDALPLAIELAAVRVTTLSVAQLAERLNSDHALLRADDARAPRHRSLEHVIEESWLQLPPIEQRALSQCGAFHGSFDVEAAEAVLQLDETAPVVDIVGRLRSKSFLRRADASGADGEIRFSLYESVRQFARKKLDAAEQRATAERRHAEYYTRICDPGLIVDERTKKRCRLEFDNLMQVAQHGPAAQSARAALALAQVFFEHGPAELHKNVLDAALHAPDLSDDVLRCRLLLARVDCHVLTGHGPLAYTDACAASELAVVCNDGALRGRAFGALAQALRDQGDFERTCSYWEQALPFARAAGDSETLAHGLCDLGYFRQNPELLVESLALCRALKLQRQEALTECTWGVLEVEGQRFASAEGHLEQALRMIRASGDHRMETMIVAHVALCLLIVGNRPRAHALLDQALELERQTGNRLYETFTTGYLALMAHQVGTAKTDVDRLRTLLGQVANTQNAWAESFATATAGAVFAQAGRIDEGRLLIKRARHLAGDMGGSTYALFLDAMDACVDLDQAASADGAAEAPALEKRAAEPLARFQKLVAAGGLTRSRSSEAVVGIQTLTLALDRYQRQAARGAFQLRPALSVGRECAWLQVGSEPRTDLNRKRTLRVLLSVLIEHRLAAPGAVVGIDTLTAAAWPGVRSRDHLKNRLHNSVAMLRRLGLREVVLSNADGYWLDPSYPAEVRE